MLFNFIKDIFKIFFFYLTNTNFKYCFFNENINTLEYLRPYILKKNKKNKVLIFSFCDINQDFENTKILFLQNNFLREFFFLTTKIKYIYSTTPDLNKSLFKRSKLSKNKYIYLQHSPLSLTKAYNHEAFHYFDAIQAIHNFHVEEIKSFKKNNIKIRYFKSNYKIIDSIKTKDSNNEQLYDLMIAPSWSTDFYNANFFKLIKKLNKEKITFFLRPHPMSIKKKEFSYSFLNKNKIKIDTSPKLDFSKSKNIISDYSGIFIEFMIKTGKKPLLINSREKILNNSVVRNKTFEQVIRENLCNPINYTNVSDYDFRNKLKNEEFINKNDILKYFY